MTWNDDLTTKLKARGYVLEDSYTDAHGVLFCVVSGEGITRCAVYRDEATHLAEGRVTLQQLLKRKEQG